MKQHTCEIILNMSRNDSYISKTI